MDIGLQSILKLQQQRLFNLHNSLAQLNPHNVLARGYALVQDVNGLLISDAAQLKPEQSVRISFAYGNADAAITHIEKPK